MVAEGFTKIEALSIERIVKNRRRKGKGKNPEDRRMDLIDQELEKRDDDHITVYMYE